MPRTPEMCSNVFTPFFSNGLYGQLNVLPLRRLLSGISRLRGRWGLRWLLEQLFGSVGTLLTITSMSYLGLVPQKALIIYLLLLIYIATLIGCIIVRLFIWPMIERYLVSGDEFTQRVSRIEQLYDLINLIQSLRIDEQQKRRWLVEIFQEYFDWLKINEGKNQCPSIGQTKSTHMGKRQGLHAKS